MEIDSLVDYENTRQKMTATVKKEEYFMYKTYEGI